MIEKIEEGDRGQATYQDKRPRQETQVRNGNKGLETQVRSQTQRQDSETQVRHKSKVQDTRDTIMEPRQETVSP